MGNARRRHFRRFFTPNEQHKPPSCLTRVSGTRARAPTARALAPAASASTRLVSSASTTSTCAVSASARGPRTLASPSSAKRPKRNLQRRNTGGWIFNGGKSRDGTESHAHKHSGLRIKELLGLLDLRSRVSHSISSEVIDESYGI